MGERIHLHVLNGNPNRLYSITGRSTVRNWIPQPDDPDLLYEVTGNDQPTGKQAKRIKNSKHAAEIF